jgi:hypothetical protein
MVIIVQRNAVLTVLAAESVKCPPPVPSDSIILVKENVVAIMEPDVQNTGLI